MTEMIATLRYGTIPIVPRDADMIGKPLLHEDIYGILTDIIEDSDGNEFKVMQAEDGKVFCQPVEY